MTSDSEEIMEMPTPCYQCGKIVELNDMNNCYTCRNGFCSDCLDRPWEFCENCKEIDNEPI